MTQYTTCRSEQDRTDSHTLARSTNLKLVITNGSTKESNVGCRALGPQRLLSPKNSLRILPEKTVFTFIIVVTCMSLLKDVSMTRLKTLRSRPLAVLPAAKSRRFSWTPHTHRPLALRWKDFLLGTAGL